MALKQLDAVREDLERKATEMLREMPEADSSFLASMVPMKPGASEDEILDLERALDRNLPLAFRRVLATYELAGLELAGVAFGGESSFSAFLRHQTSSPRSVWGRWQPIHDLFVVGSSAGYVVFVSNNDGRVWACLRDRAIEEKMVVASDLERFLRALGTLTVTETVENDDALAAEMARDVDAVGSESFWADRIKGYG